MKQTEYGNDECPVEARSISVFFLCERLIPQREKLEQRKGTGEVTYVTEHLPVHGWYAKRTLKILVFLVCGRL